MTNERALVTVGTQPMPATRENVKTMERFVQVMDPTAPPKAVWSLAVVAVRLGLHPLNNEVMLYEGQPFITIHGRRRLAERSGDLAAIQPDILTDRERRKALGALSEGDIVGVCNVYRKSDERPTIQYAIVRSNERWPSDKEATALGISQEALGKLRAKDDPDGLFALISNPKAKVRPIVMFPHLMAMKRAESRALDALAGVPLPTYDPQVGVIGEGAMPAYLLQEDPNGEPAPAGSPSAPGPAPPVEGPPAASAPTSGREPVGPPRADPYPGLTDQQLTVPQLYRRIAAREGRPDPGEPEP